MARFFMSYPGSRVAEIDGNNNFVPDGLDVAVTGDYANPWLSGPIKLAGFGYVSPRNIIELNPSRYYGRGKTGTAVDSWKGIPVTNGVHGLNQALLSEPKFTQCAVRSMWKMLLGREVASHESIQFSKIVASLIAQDNYTAEDIIRSIVLSDAFRKEY
jgi:hypothetical protein